MIPERPRLRPLEAFPITADGRQLICIRDPTNVSEAVLMFPPSVVPILAALDGEHSILDIQAAETRRQGRLVFGAEIERLIRTLDEHLFLDGPTLDAARRAQRELFHQSPVRPAFHAGKAYDGDPGALRTKIDSFFTHPEGPGLAQPEGPRRRLTGVLAPHIDFHRGGPAYAWAYKALGESEPADLYVILGTCHAGLDGPFAVTLKPYDTPFGPLAVDRDFVEALGRRSGLDLFEGELGHRTEHAIEFQAVFLQYLFAGRREVRTVPILASFLHELMALGKDPAQDSDVQRFVEALGETIASWPGKICLVGGVDLAHVGPRFGDSEPVTEAMLRRVAEEDLAMLAHVTTGDADGFYESVARDGDRRRICGLSPIYTLLRVMKGQGSLLRYAQWPDPQGTVTFASLVFSREGG